VHARHYPGGRKSRVGVCSTILALVAGLGGSAAGAGSAPPKHLSLEAAVGSCSILGGEAAFYLCPPGTRMPPVNLHGRVRVELTGRARSSNGRRVFEETDGIGQVILENGWAFGPDSGVDVSGQLKRGSVVMFSFAPTPRRLRGYAVWKLPTDASALRIATKNRASTTTLVVDGRPLRSAMVISPAREIRDPAVARIFKQDMQHLQAVARGDARGACQFFRPTPRSASASDAECARSLGGLKGKSAAIEASIAAAKLFLFNGFTIAQSHIDRESISWVLDRGHFRLPYGYKLV
jgi:hypothetical protein